MRAHAWLLGVLSLAFAGRVAGQLLVASGLDGGVLPPMAVWHSGLLPYPALVVAQLGILLVQAELCRELWVEAGPLVRSRPLVGRVLAVVAALYAGGMLARGAVAHLFLPEPGRLGNVIPIVFHLVLATHLWVTSRVLRRRLLDVRRILSWVAFPGTLAGALAVYAGLAQLGLPRLAAAYVAAVGAAGVVTTLERVIPYERRWRPRWSEVRNDLLFMVAVQMVWPQALALAVALWLVDAVAASGLPVATLWPSGLPTVVQVVLMLLVAEAFRYPLHVAAHNTKSLWRLHAVHHSPHRLYWLNVGRFHPIEKTLQYGVDTVPFVLLGVGADVVALYFVFYAVNGFYQHSNVDVRYGPLNYLVSGPELHRWHHSRRIVESNRNYGNNLVVWDLLFGTWFLPRERRVGDLGLLNREYPSGFWRQLVAPLTPGLDKAPPSPLAPPTDAV